MKRSAAASIRRTVRRGLTWRAKKPGGLPLDIAELVSPLRYDVQVRADFFTWLASDPVAGLGDGELIDAAAALPYAYWFEHVAMARFRPWVLADRDLLRAQFAERVVSARRLAESFNHQGFDRRRPVTLRATRGNTAADSGAWLSKTLHIGDGGHRTALVLASGRQLEPWMYVIDRRPMPLIDNTRILDQGLHLDECTYARFISREFLPVPLDSLAELRALVEAKVPERRSELESVLMAHGRGRSTPPVTAPTEVGR